MTEWYLWDGENQFGPIDLNELENRIRYHPRPDIVRVWRAGLANWQAADEALGPRQVLPPPLPLVQTLNTASPARRNNFVALHWRGEYPLWVSYWIVGVLSNIFAVIVVVVIGVIAGRPAYNPISILLFYSALWSFIVGLSVWQLVGIWRSAGHRMDEGASIGKRSPWAIVARIMVCIGALQTVSVLIREAIPQVSEAVRIAVLDDPDIQDYSIRVMNNGSEAEITGGIKYGVASDFEKILNASKGVRLVHLDSNGGRLGEGQKLNAIIRSRGLDTYVDSKCLSACTLAFVAGRQRILKRGAQLGFHRGSFAGEDQIDDRSSGIERSIFVAAGINGPFIDRALATRNADMWRPSEAELVSAGVVTKMSDGGEYALAGLGGNKMTRDDWEAGFQKVAVYRALKEKYPAVYSEILEVFNDGVTKGLPQASVMGEARAKLAGFIKRLLPQADDEVLVEFGKLIVEQYRSLQAQDKAACYAFASGQSGEAAIRMIPKQLADRELDLNARIVSSARMRDIKAKDDQSWERIRERFRLRGYNDKDWELLAATTVSPLQHARYCEMAITLYQVVTTLPTQEAASVLRELFS